MRRLIGAVLGVAALLAAPAAAAGAPANGQLAAVWGADRLVTFNADGSALRTVWQADGVSAPVWSPDGNRLAFLVNDGVTGTKLAVHSLATGATKVITSHPAPVGGSHRQDWDPGWTADGRIVFRRATFTSETAKHVLMSIAPDGTGLAELPIGEVPGGDVSWTGDGWVLYRDSSHALHLASLDGEHDEILPAPWLRFPIAWSPDGWWLAYGDKQIIALDLEDGEEYELTTPAAGFSDSAPAWSPDGASLVFKRSAASGGEEIRIVNFESGANGRVITGNFFAPAWQPCVAGVTVRCKSEPLGCLAPGAPAGLDPQPLCSPVPIAVPVPVVTAPQPRSPVIAPRATAQLHKRKGQVEFRVWCPTRCKVVARVNVRLRSGRVLRGRTISRTARSMTLRLKVPKVPRKQRAASIRVIATATGSDGIAWQVSSPVKR